MTITQKIEVGVGVGVDANQGRIPRARNVIASPPQMHLRCCGHVRQQHSKQTLSHCYPMPTHATGMPAPEATKARRMSASDVAFLPTYTDCNAVTGGCMHGCDLSEPSLDGGSPARATNGRLGFVLSMPVIRLAPHLLYHD